MPSPEVATEQDEGHWEVVTGDAKDAEYIRDLARRVAAATQPASAQE